MPVVRNISNMDLYVLMRSLFTDWLMMLVAFSAVITTLLRYKVRRNSAIIGVIIAFIAATIFYTWQFVFNPDASYRSAVGRLVVFSIMVSVDMWNVLVIKYGDK